MAPKDFFIGVGSNIEPTRNVPAMLDALLVFAPQVQVSPIVVTEPVSIPDSGGVFWNLAATLRTDRPAGEVKEYFNSVERALGRDRDDPHRKYRDRVADLDILFTIDPEAAEVPRDLLPAEAYLRPQVDALLEYVGVAVRGEADHGAAGWQPSVAQTVVLEYHGRVIGPASATLQRPETHSEREDRP